MPTRLGTIALGNAATSTGPPLSVKPGNCCIGKVAKRAAASCEVPRGTPEGGVPPRATLPNYQDGLFRGFEVQRNVKPRDVNTRTNLFDNLLANRPLSGK